jgi:RNase adapter protein RapZ
VSQPKTTPYKIVLVTGMSGAGRSTALKILEDLGYKSIDNLPLNLFPHLCEQIPDWQDSQPLAIGIDTRSYGFDLNRLEKMFENMRSRPTLSVWLLYLECENDVLLRRFTETRRRHPFADSSLPEAIFQERKMMEPLQSLADLVIDTSALSRPIFGQMIRQHFSLEESPSIFIRMLSFSYRRGIPKEADMVFDARFLSNPYYEKSFRDLSGKDAPVQEYLTQDENWQTVYGSLQRIIHYSLKGFRLTGRSYLTIACGCTGGQHRSVFLTEQLSKWLYREGETVMIEHRDLSQGI